MNNGKEDKDDDSDWHFCYKDPKNNLDIKNKKRFVPFFALNYTNPSAPDLTYDEILPDIGPVRYSKIIPFDKELDLAKFLKQTKHYREKPKKPQSEPKIMFEQPKHTPQINEYEEASSDERFDEYKTSILKIGSKHPFYVVESDNLAAVVCPAITYKLKLEQEVIEMGMLSSLQLESVIYACQAHEKFLNEKCRAGYLIGDGLGVGKGRIIAGIIKENILNGRPKSLWLSVSSQLIHNAQNDLVDVGGNVKVVDYQTIFYNDKIDEFFEDHGYMGVLFASYASLMGISDSRDAHYSNRYEQLMEWLTPGFDGVIVFDDIHSIKHLTNMGTYHLSDIGIKILKLQTDLPDARIVYSSSDGIWKLRNLACMPRLGLWGEGTPFPKFKHLFSVFRKGDVSALDLLAMDMKHRGIYSNRQLGFSGVTFKFTNNFIIYKYEELFESCAAIWDKFLIYFTKAFALLRYSLRDKANSMAKFYSAHKRFYTCLQTSTKVRKVVEITKNELKNNKAVVIGMQWAGEEVGDRVFKRRRFTRLESTCTGILHELIKNHFPSLKMRGSISKTKKGAKGEVKYHTEVKYAKVRYPFDKYRRLHSIEEDEDAINEILSRMNDNHWEEEPAEPGPKKELKASRTALTAACKQMKEELLANIEELGKSLPPNTIDSLLQKLGGHEKVAEISGRRWRMVKTVYKEIVLEQRHFQVIPLDTVNIYERDNFMQDKKNVVIISEPASSGLYLHCDKAAENTRKRVHIILELSWDPNRTIQQFYRTHRPNQLYSPEYILIVNDIGVDELLANFIAKRLVAMGAINLSDSLSKPFNDFNPNIVDTKFGLYALNKMINILNEQVAPGCDLPKYPGDFLVDAKNITSVLYKKGYELENRNSRNGKIPDVHKLVDRLLGTKLDIQGEMYEFYASILSQLIRDSNANGIFDFGIIDYGLDGDIVYKKSKTRFEIRYSSSVAIVELLSFDVKRGLSFEQAHSMIRDTVDPHVGFYTANGIDISYHQQIMLVLKNITPRTSKTLYTYYRPNTGKGTKCYPIDILTKNYQKTEPMRVESDWTMLYESTEWMCIHEYFQGYCDTQVKTGSCDVGKRIFSINLICGAFVHIWKHIQETFGGSPLRLARITKKDNTQRIGILLPHPLKEVFISRITGQKNESISKN